MSDKKKIKVLNIAVSWGSTSAIGGVSTYIMNNYRKMDRKNIEYYIISFHPHEAYFEEEFKTLGGKMIYSPIHSKFKLLRWFEMWRSVKKQLRQYQFDVVYLHIGWALELIYLYFAYQARIPIRIAHAHITTHNYKPVKKWIHNMCIRVFEKYATVRLACSEEAAQSFFTGKVRSNKEYKIIKNCIEPEKFIFNEMVRKLKREELKIQTDCFLVGFIGRISPAKNLPYIVNIFVEILIRNINSKLLIMGDGAEKSKLIQLCKDKEIIDDVIFLGSCDCVNEYMWALDLFLMPSIMEGFGITALEAQAAALHCLASTAIPEQAVVNQYLERISLEESLDVWTNKALSYADGYQRKNCEKDITNAGYDIRNSVTELEKIYKQ